MVLVPLAMLLFLAMPGAASASRVPTVTQGIAEEMAGRNLRAFPGWRYRQYGYIDCAHGRINRTEWSCRVGWIHSGGCRRGRVRVYGEYVYEGRKFFASNFKGYRGC